MGVIWDDNFATDRAAEYDIAYYNSSTFAFEPVPNPAAAPEWTFGPGLGPDNTSPVSGQHARDYAIPRAFGEIDAGLSLTGRAVQSDLQFLVALFDVDTPGTIADVVTSAALKVACIAYISTTATQMQVLAFGSVTDPAMQSTALFDRTGAFTFAINNRVVNGVTEASVIVDGTVVAGISGPTEGFENSGADLTTEQRAGPWRAYFQPAWVSGEVPTDFTVTRFQATAGAVVPVGPTANQIAIGGVRRGSLLT